MNYLLKNIDPDFWKKVKMWCLEHDITIKDLILKLLRKEISK